MIGADRHLRIGTFLFDGIDQIDVAGSFEVLSCLTNVTHRLHALAATPMRGIIGLRLLPDDMIARALPLDVRHVPGCQNQQEVMENAAVLDRKMVAVRL